MISFVRGTVVHVHADSLVVDLGAVGVTVQCTQATTLSVRTGEHVELMTSMVVREDGWTMYGFVEPDERTVFDQVQTVTGIGPRIAMALLGTLTPDDLRRAVQSADEATITRVPGIGRKGAQRLILELADRLGPPGPPSADAKTLPAAGLGGWQGAVSAGLTSLGWSGREADQAVAAIGPDIVAAATAGTEPDVGALLKAALRSLDRP
jgi:Holliday junction DNA helicase RuvA